MSEQIKIPELPSSAETDSFLADVVTGDVPLDELKPRFNARNGAATDGSYYIFRRPDGSLVRTESSRLAIRESRPTPTPEQQAVIVRVAETRQRLLETEKGLNSTASFLADVVTGDVPLDELKPRFNARNGAATDGSYYIFRRPDGSLVRTESSRLAIRESRPTPTPEQQAVIVRVAENAERRKRKSNTPAAAPIARMIVSSDNFTSQQRTDMATRSQLDASVTQELEALASLKTLVADKEIDDLVLQLFETGDDSAVIARINAERESTADVSDEGSVSGNISTLAAYAQAARRINLRSQFWEDAGNTGGDEARLGGYQELDLMDTELVRELRGDALDLRGDRLVVNIFAGLAAKEPNYQSVAIMLDALARVNNASRDESSGANLVTATNTAYSAEITSIFNSYYSNLTLDLDSVRSTRDALETAQVRPAIAGVDFFERFNMAKAEFEATLGVFEKLAIDREIVELRKQFLSDTNVQGAIDTILDLPGDDEEAMQLRQDLLDELSYTVTATRGINPGRFAVLKQIQLQGIRERRSGEVKQVDLTEIDTERNAEAVKLMVERYQSHLMPLFEALRGANNLTERYVSGRTGQRDAFVQRVDALREQRDLTEIELAYLSSVEALTVFNPHLVALLREAPELTSLYLEEHFSELGAKTKESLVPDMCVPLIQIGLGPNGLASAGELSRSNPTLSRQALFIDAIALPGGPFGEAKGPSWELNSANSVSNTTNILPDITNLDVEGKTVRSYGSPLVAYPGERKTGSDVRQGSINATVDYLPNPDNVSTKRYPTNVDLARVLQLQAAMLVDQALFETRVTNVEFVDGTGQNEQKRVTIEFTGADGETVISTIRTDKIVVAGGLGSPNYGVNLDNSEAAAILTGDNIAPDGFPKLTDTIEAFSVLSDPEGAAATPKGTIVIYGGGNSADVLIEYLGRQFESGNTSLNGITKVIVVTNAQLSQRPRYAQINDLKSRNGQPSFLEIVPGRVADVAQTADGRLRLVDNDGNDIISGQNGSQGPIIADHVIAASGFSPELDTVFAPLLSAGESLDARIGTGKVTLPNNPGFSIADTLRADANVVVVGTASRADFQNPNKLAQLPATAREALLRNGAENAVAIGFRTPDTRAAIRTLFEGAEFAATELSVSERRISIDPTEKTDVEISVPVTTNVNVRRDIRTDSETLTGLILGAIPKLTLQEGGEVAQSARSFIVDVKYDDVTSSFVVAADVPKDLSDAVVGALENDYVQAYAQEAIRQRRTNRGLRFSLAFDRGRLVYRDKGQKSENRTYVEAI